MLEHEAAQKRFYDHLKMHPHAHATAKKLVAKLKQRDPQAVHALKSLARCAHSDPRAANALRIIAVTHKFESGPAAMIMGAVPAAVHATGKVLKLALSPAAWALDQGAGAFHWAGRSLQHIAAAI